MFDYQVSSDLYYSNASRIPPSPGLGLGGLEAWKPIRPQGFQNEAPRPPKWRFWVSKMELGPPKWVPGLQNGSKFVRNRLGWWFGGP